MLQGSATKRWRKSSRSECGLTLTTGC
jgi:hypothetical protein